MKLNSKRKFDIVEVEEENEFNENDSDFLGDLTYKKYKFIQAFSKLSIGADEDQSENGEIESDNNFDSLYADLTQKFNKNITITYTERVAYKKMKPSQQTDQKIKYLSITDGFKDINLFKHQQTNLANVIFNLYKEISPAPSDSLVVYKGNPLNVLVNNFMSYLKNRKIGHNKQKAKVENVQKDTMKVIIEETNLDEETEQIQTA